MIRKSTFEELENLPQLTHETFGWSLMSVPMIFVLCKDFDDKERMFDCLCKKKTKLKNPILFVDCKEDMFGQNGFAIIKSKEFDNDTLFECAITRLMGRISKDKNNDGKFYPYMVVEEE
jgi:hypothetical protein